MDQRLPDGHTLPDRASEPGTVKRGRYGAGGGYMWLPIYADGAEATIVFHTKTEALRELETQTYRKAAVKEAYDTLARFTAADPHGLLQALTDAGRYIRAGRSELALAVITKVVG